MQSNLPPLEIARHLRVGFHQLFVLDNLFSSADIASLFSLLERVPYSFSDFDTDETAYSRHWKSEIPIPLSIATPIYRDCIAVANRLFAPSALRLKRVHSNLHLYGDMQYPHRDLAHGITALYYANPDWNEKWLGETVFYGEEREPLYTVSPKPGRLVVFDADIVHRGGVPSRECYRPRISVAFKFIRD